MAQKKNLTIVGAVLVLVLAAAAALFMFWQREPEGLVVGISTLPDSLNPVLEQNLQGKNANELVFDGLANFEVDVASGKLNAELALADSITQDPVTKTTYTVVLKDVNVNGTSFTPGSALMRGHRYTWYVAAVSVNGQALFYNLTTPQTFTTAEF
jgi:hypothetical protein